jgi:small subunit ribosomal protein S11
MLKKKLISKTGILFISTTLNNTFVNVTDLQGNTLCCVSSGGLGFKGSKKSSSYAAQAATEKVLHFCILNSIDKLIIKFRGVGYSKDAALKSVLTQNFQIIQIQETTQKAFNGCRQRKKRRV